MDNYGLGRVWRLEDPEVSADEGELDHGEVVGGELLVAGSQPPVVLEPPHAPLHDVAAPVLRRSEASSPLVPDLIGSLGDHVEDAPTLAPPSHTRIGSFKRECLNHFWCFGMRHLDHITQTYVGYYNRHRPHQSLGNVPLGRAERSPPILAAAGQLGHVHRQVFLGGLLNHCERRAA